MVMNFHPTVILVGRTDLTVSEHPVLYEQGCFLAASFGAIAYFEGDAHDKDFGLELFKHSMEVKSIASSNIKGTFVDNFLFNRFCCRFVKFWNLCFPWFS